MLQAAAAPAAAAPPPAATGLWDDDDDFLAGDDHEALDLGLGIGNGSGFGAGMAAGGFGAGMGLALGAGMDAGAAVAAAAAADTAPPSFMHDDAEDGFEDSIGLPQTGPLQPLGSGSFSQQQQQGALMPHGSLQYNGSLQSTGSLQQAAGGLPLVGAGGSGDVLYSPTVAVEQYRQPPQQHHVHALVYSPTDASTAAPHAPLGAAAAAAAFARHRPGVRFSDDGAATWPPPPPPAATTTGVAVSGRYPGCTPSPADPGEQQQPPPTPQVQQEQPPPPPPPPQQQQQQQQQHHGGSVVAQVLQRRTKCSKLIPSLGGLLNHINSKGLTGIKIFLDASIAEKGDRVRAMLR